ncbi:MAG: TSUP family transporter [Candidatus Hadarchaeum sp.]|uniref:TSUP family transporter n=1 Tax=Candidatus Hadarchaeum sp. TaxID=2883567 RepID=UPI003D126536
MIELILLSLLIATVFSMVGLVGGVLIVPALVLLFSLTTQQAVGVSLFAVMFTTISATLTYAVRGKINYRVGLLLDTLDVPGAVVGRTSPR